MSIHRRRQVAGEPLQMDSWHGWIRAAGYLMAGSLLVAAAFHFVTAAVR